MCQLSKQRFIKRSVPLKRSYLNLQLRLPELEKLLLPFFFSVHVKGNCAGRVTLKPPISSVLSQKHKNINFTFQLGKKMRQGEVRQCLVVTLTV